MNQIKSAMTKVTGLSLMCITLVACAGTGGMEEDKMMKSDGMADKGMMDTTMTKDKMDKPMMDDGMKKGM